MKKYLAFFTTFNLDKLNAYLELMRMHRPIGILLLLWPTLVSLWIAEQGFPDIDLLMIFFAGVVVMRSAGCVINDHADRKVDGAVSRTKSRPLVTGLVTKEEARVLFFLLMTCALVLVLFLNINTLYWAIAGALLTMIYPLAKRFTWFPQVILGATFGWCVPIAFVASEQPVNELVWLIYFTNLIWIVMYDTLYAMVDRDDDLSVGIRSTAILFGDADRMIIGMMQAMTLAGMLIIGLTQNYGLWYQLPMVGVAGLFIYQQFLIKDRQPANCFKAFLNNNYVGAVWFLAVLLQFLMQ
ncbi:MAG: 4-hydroxybenzoate octaprenyltransferase [Gammaproteobacteria bacterium]|jgi:4-hydroxybenzoate polyprenyltransferase